MAYGSYTFQIKNLIVICPKFKKQYVRLKKFCSGKNIPMYLEQNTEGYLSA